MDCRSMGYTIHQSGIYFKDRRTGLAYQGSAIIAGFVTAATRSCVPDPQATGLSANMPALPTMPDADPGRSVCRSPISAKGYKTWILTRPAVLRRHYRF